MYIFEQGSSGQQEVIALEDKLRDIAALVQ